MTFKSNNFTGLLFCLPRACGLEDRVVAGEKD